MDWVVATHYLDVPPSKLVQDNYTPIPTRLFTSTYPLKESGSCATNSRFTSLPNTALGSIRTKIEFSALSHQCLNRRIGSAQQLEGEALIWQAHRNAAATKICWSFTSEKAHDKLNNQYQEAVKKE